MTARQRHYLRTRAHQRARREGRTLMSGIVNIMVAPPPRLTSGSVASNRRAEARVWDAVDRLWMPQGTGAGPRIRTDLFDALGVKVVFR